MQTATTFNHETVVLDGESFSDCEFRDCRLIYSGGEAPSFSDCKFDKCEWKIDGPAAQTMAHLKAVWAAGGKSTVQLWIKEITGGGR
jgi:hypothetical protein